MTPQVAFAVIESLVGFFHQLALTGLLLRYPAGDPNAGRNPAGNWAGFMVDAGGIQGVNNDFRQSTGFGQPSFWQQNREFLATDTAYKVGAAEHLDFYRICNFLEAEVSFNMPVAIVVKLEMVHIQQK